MLSDLVWPKVITLSGAYCSSKSSNLDHFKSRFIHAGRVRRMLGWSHRWTFPKSFANAGPDSSSRRRDTLATRTRSPSRDGRRRISFSRRIGNRCRKVGPTWSRTCSTRTMRKGTSKKLEMVASKKTRPSLDPNCSIIFKAFLSTRDTEFPLVEGVRTRVTTNRVRIRPRSIGCPEDISGSGGGDCNNRNEVKTF